MKRPKYGNKNDQRQWVWAHERKAKSTPVDLIIPRHVCGCGCRYVNKYRAHYYCRNCGTRMNTSRVEIAIAKENR